MRQTGYRSILMLTAIAIGCGQDGGSAESGQDTGISDSVEAVETECPTPNDSFTAGCEPLIPVCETALPRVSADSYKGSFGSLLANGECQSEWPAPYLSDCTEPLPEGVPDLRGLWADNGHVERVEQCGNLVIIVGENYTHGGYATGDVADGVNDYRGDGTCSQTIEIALSYEGNALLFKKGSLTVVTRTLEVAADGEDELVWRFGPGLTELARMRRHCQLTDVPATASSGLPSN